MRFRRSPNSVGTSPTSLFSADQRTKVKKLYLTMWVNEVNLATKSPHIICNWYSPRLKSAKLDKCFSVFGIVPDKWFSSDKYDVYTEMMWVYRIYKKTLTNFEMNECQYSSHYTYIIWWLFTYIKSRSSIQQAVLYPHHFLDWTILALAFGWFFQTDYIQKLLSRFVHSISLVSDHVVNYDLAFHQVSRPISFTKIERDTVRAYM